MLFLLLSLSASSFSMAFLIEFTFAFDGCKLSVMLKLIIVFF